jgi:thiamine-monophosphate kinase
VKTLGDLGEFGLIARVARIVGDPGVEIGIGDDAAIVRIGGGRVVLTTDALVEDVHFRRGWETPRRLGRRAFAVNASDVAAMGGIPRASLLSIVAPRSESAHDLLEIHRGFAGAAREHGAPLVGGNVSGGPVRMISVTLVGEAPRRPLRRDGARVGDLVFVGGPLGRNALARERRLAGARGSRHPPLPLPSPRIVLGRALAERRLSRAAIDLSDGLVQDLEHVCAASGVGAELELEAIPLAPALRRLARDAALELALHGGEDYELLFTAPARKRAAIEALASPAPVVIGRIVAGSGVVLVDRTGRRRRARPAGFDHFGRGARGRRG